MERQQVRRVTSSNPLPPPASPAAHAGFFILTQCRDRPSASSAVTTKAKAATAVAARNLDTGNSIVERVAGVDDFEVAEATYRAAVARWPRARITLRQGARVIEDSRRLRVV
jgi:hypothetical protein